MRWTALALSILVLSCGGPAQELTTASTALERWSSLNVFSIDRIPWARRVALLRLGDSRRRIEALLGPAPDVRRLGSLGNGATQVLVYPNLDAPRDLKPEQRQILFYLDAAGFLLVTFDMSMSC